MKDLYSYIQSFSSDVLKIVSGNHELIEMVKNKLDETINESRQRYNEINNGSNESGENRLHSLSQLQDKSPHKKRYRRRYERK